MLAAACATLSAQGMGFDRNEFVATHNEWRAKVGVTQKLGYSKSLEASAQAWADVLKKSNRCRMRHSKSDGSYGENLYWASAVNWSDGRKELQKVTPRHVVDSWGSEKADYNYNKNSCVPGKVCGHYTQVVWRTTTAVGCAMAVCNDDKTQIWVCQYKPAGNWIGERPY